MSYYPGLQHIPHSNHCTSHNIHYYIHINYYTSHQPLYIILCIALHINYYTSYQPLHMTSYDYVPRCSQEHIVYHYAMCMLKVGCAAHALSILAVSAYTDNTSTQSHTSSDSNSFLQATPRNITDKHHEYTLSPTSSMEGTHCTYTHTTS